MKKSVSILFLFLFCVALQAGNLKLPTALSDNVVLQRNGAARIWGWAKPGKGVTVTPSWGGSYTTKADKAGAWEVLVTTGDAAEGLTIDVASDKETLSIKNVALGEVWICSGQSNMQFKVENSLDANKYLVNPNAKIRTFNSGRISANEPQQDIPGVKWCLSDNEDAVGDFSAVGYVFGDALQKALDCPIGLMCLSYGGTPVEAWTPADMLNPKFKSINETMLTQPKYEKKAAKLAVATDWNANVAPVVNMTVAGVIWYQGCQNVAYSAVEYGDMLENMIKAWREKFCYADMPFYVVQLVPHLPYDGIKGALVREGQARTAAKMDHVEIVSTIDLGDRPGDIHPRYKVPVGERLAAAALGEHYGKDVVWKMPCYKSMTVEGNKVRVSFDNVVGGLCPAEKGIYGFQIAGDDFKYQVAKASIDGDDIILSNAKVENPVYVRYCFNEYPGTLRTGCGLPVMPFRTDVNNEAKGTRDYYDKKALPAFVIVSGGNFTSEPQNYDNGVKLWSNREYGLKSTMGVFRGYQVAQTFWVNNVEDKTATMAPFVVTAATAGRVYILTKSFAYLYDACPEWTVMPPTKTDFIDGKKRVKGFVIMAYKDMVAGEKYAFPSYKNNPAGVAVMAREVTVQK